MYKGPIDEPKGRRIEGGRWGEMGHRRAVGGKWRQLYLSNNKKNDKKKNTRRKRIQEALAVGHVVA